MSVDYCKLEQDWQNLIPCKNMFFLRDDINGFFLCSKKMLKNSECPMGECPEYKPKGTWNCDTCQEDCEIKALMDGDA